MRMVELLIVTGEERRRSSEQRDGHTHRPTLKKKTKTRYVKPCPSTHPEQNMEEGWTHPPIYSEQNIEPN
jgi:hypothetical protein